MSAYVNGDIGIIRFIGNVESLNGIHLGIELRKPSKLHVYSVLEV